SRLICFDQRGTGLSDPVPLGELPNVDHWMDDVTAVMEATGSRQAAILGSGGGGVVGTVYAASKPERTQALVLVNSFARLAWAPDYPAGTTDAFEERVQQDLRATWGRDALIDLVAPSEEANPAFRRWLSRYQRLGSSPGTVIAFRRMLRAIDVRGVVSAIRVPTLIIHRADNRLVVRDHGRYLAEHVPDATYREVPGVDYFPFIGDSGPILDAVEEFLTGTRQAPETDRLLATVLFTDIVDSTRHAARLGDAGWRSLLEQHHAVVREHLARFAGHEVDTAGDGFFATFDGPARAVRCALQLARTLPDLGVQIRAGVHTGEVQRLGGEKIGGLAVHIGSRVAARARAGQVLVTSTVRDLAAGAGIGFADAGSHALKGVPGRWRLYLAADADRVQRESRPLE
ncbi:MAG TPA: adenylate/guanylate cyclase domain-containing protein, partial [Candidatus Limnocylindria bacterium]|nr:adenylate/guanylate cyclase domain-containing protein [Candidatus Limnocylindria bacterium]